MASTSSRSSKLGFFLLTLFGGCCLIPTMLVANAETSAEGVETTKYSPCRPTRKFNSAIHKKVYTVAVLAFRGDEAAWNGFNATFNDYLSATVGQQFDPPIKFEMKPVFKTLFEEAKESLVDYVYVNPGQFSCIESEFEAYSLASQVSRRTIGNNIYDLKKFGGVILARAENDEVETIYDLKDKVVAAASITGLGSGQMQFLEMQKAGMDYLNDPSQLVFTRNQGKIVNGVLNGNFDVGFIRTDQLERTKDADGNPVDLNSFKVIDPKPGLNIDGAPFPFEASTPLYPEWNIAALSHVPDDVSAEVQAAMLAIADHGTVGNRWMECLDQFNETYCDQLPFPANFTSSEQLEARCDTTKEIGSLAAIAMANGKYSAFTPTLSYMQLRSMQQATGFISPDQNGDWHCTRSSDLYGAITCPPGQVLKSPVEFEHACQDKGLECDGEYQCICQPCYTPQSCDSAVEIGGKCVPFKIFLPALLLPIAILSVGIFWFVVRRQTKKLKKQKALTAQNDEIISSLFPKRFRDRMISQAAETSPGLADNLAMAPNHLLKTYLTGGNEKIAGDADKPIADLFARCTVFFADIAGFTAWSSTREPAQVFVLLQTVYQAFDSLAKRNHVFKVETIGDSYVAVTGLPEEQPNHAFIMVRFAWACLARVSQVLKDLETTLGPDTGDLGMRFGLHSGPVTAGVLRGERARFQLFGDTVNTAARMESTGERNRIQISKATADLLAEAGKMHWLEPREDAVNVKGKGLLHTFWLKPSEELHGGSTSTGSNIKRDPDLRLMSGMPPDQEMRLIDWVTKLLSEHVKKIVAARQFVEKAAERTTDVSYMPPEESTCLDEVKEVMAVPEFNPRAAAIAVGDAPSDILIPEKIMSALREYVELIVISYNNENPFHNFSHACHVTMSVSKLIKRIVAPDLSSDKVFDARKRHCSTGDLASQLHNFSHGIVSDPMTVFAIVFSALIHDVDHRGVSNTQLISEQPTIAAKYRNKSIAEQNSLDLAWEALMLDQFEELRRFIFGNQEGLMRFRQLIVNVVLATDIFDKELNDLRKIRWSRAFSDAHAQDDNVNDLRATIVMEHIIQASDVSHTMQHWNVYRKWNARLFTEMYTAFKAGRMGTDPSTFWYEGELKFFDNYVIPLAKKLEECNVFGVSSDEYLTYATLNRGEWEEKGQEIVKELMAQVGPSCVCENTERPVESQRSSSGHGAAQ